MQAGAFLGDNDTAPQAGGSSPQKYFGLINRHFQAKITKYYNSYIIKTTSSIPTKFALWWIPPNTLHGWSKLV